MICDSKDHSRHMCALKERGLDHCVRILSEKSRVECRYCGARANSLRNICGCVSPEARFGHEESSL